MIKKLDLSKIRAVMLDMDGVVYIGDTPLPGTQELVSYLESTGRQWLCVTNNSSKTPEMFVEKLARMDIPATTDNVFGSAQATATWLAGEVPLENGSRGKVIMIGEEGLRRALVENQFEITEDVNDADLVVSGINFQLTYEMLARATLAIRNGARFIGTNSDPSFPSERGLVPGAGSIIALLSTSTGQEATVIGKPNAGMFEQALDRLGVTVEETLMVGDRYDTDIEGAIKIGMQTVGVLTGVTSREEFEAEAAPPDAILDGLPELLELFQMVP